MIYKGWCLAKLKPIICAEEVFEKNNWFRHAFYDSLAFDFGARVTAWVKFTHIFFEKVKKRNTVTEQFGFSVYTFEKFAVLQLVFASYEKQLPPALWR